MTIEVSTLLARYLLDTGIILALLRVNELSRAIEAAYALRSAPIPPLISVVTRGEMQSLARRRGWGETRRRRLRVLLDQFRTIPLEHPGLIEAYGEIDAYSLNVGRPMGKNDVWIAATARVTGTRLLTMDQDFDHLDPRFLSRDYIDPQSRP
jgi:tRNA(fMet)-specific endonuclease VapC